MKESRSVSYLFDTAIEAERVAEQLYHTLSRKFAPHPNLVRFWKGMATDEVTHARALESIRAELPEETLQARADPEILAKARHALRTDLDRSLPHVTNLEEAYQLVSDLEHSETNAIFEFLVLEFSNDIRLGNFLRSQLRNHVMRLVVDFTEEFGPAERRAQVQTVQIETDEA
jgi:hypothetical protein